MSGGFLALRGVGHWLRRGHAPEFIRLGPELICQICDLGSPTGSYIPPLRVAAPLFG